MSRTKTNISGRKLHPRRVSLLPALFCLALACLILAIWLLYMR